MSSARSYHISLVTCLPYMTLPHSCSPKLVPVGSHNTQSTDENVTTGPYPTLLAHSTERELKKNNKKSFKNRTTRVKRRDHTMLVISLYKWSGACTSHLIRWSARAGITDIENVSASLITMTLDYSCLIYFNVLITYKAAMTVTTLPI